MVPYLKIKKTSKQIIKTEQMGQWFGIVRYNSELETGLKNAWDNNKWPACDPTDPLHLLPVMISSTSTPKL